MRHTTIDLFAGAGGATLGLEDAGFHCLGAVEVHPVYSATFVANFGHRPVSYLGPKAGDIRKLDSYAIKEELRQLGCSVLDVLLASPPCQRYSFAGRNKKAFPGDLYHHAVRLLRVLQPLVFVLENVPGMLYYYGRNAAEDVCAAVEEAGYVVRCTLLNAVWYGVPQLRDRVIIMGVHRDLKATPRFPAKRFYTPHDRHYLATKTPNSKIWSNPEYFVDPRQLPTESPQEPAVTVAEAFDDLPPFREHLVALKDSRPYKSTRKLFKAVEYQHPPRNWYCHKMRNWNESLVSTRVTDHFCRWMPRDFGTFERMKPGDRYREALQVAEVRYQEAIAAWNTSGGTKPRRQDFVPPYPLDSFTNKWRKLVPAAPSWTVVSNVGLNSQTHIHYDSSQARTITPREAARLQSFPDAFQCTGTTRDMFQQIGNAVPPLLARALGNTIAEILNQAKGGTP